MSTANDPPASPLAKLNPGWITAAIGLVTSIGLLGAGFVAIQSHDTQIRELQIWRSAKDVADTDLRVNVSYIKEAIQRMESRTAPGSQQQPQVIYLPMPQQGQGRAADAGH